MNALHLIRHSLTEGNERRLYYGSTDLSLSDAGRELCQSLRGTYRLSDNVCFATSGMLRTEETLRELFGDVPHQTLQALREMEMGAFEMHSYDELKDNPDYQAWLSDLTDTFVIPGGESNLAVRKRVTECIQTLAQSRTDEMLIVCHGGVIAAAMHAFFRDPGRSFYDWIPHACHGYTILFRNSKPDSWHRI